MFPIMRTKSGGLENRNINLFSSDLGGPPMTYGVQYGPDKMPKVQLEYPFNVSAMTRNVSPRFQLCPPHVITLTKRCLLYPHTYASLKTALSGGQGRRG